MNDAEFSTVNNRGSVTATISQTSPTRTAAAKVVKPTVVKPVAAKVDSSFPTLPLPLSFRKSAVRQNDVAVIIGNANYAKFGKGIPNVTPAYADAAGFKKYVTEALGVRVGNIIDLRDATYVDFASIFGTERNHKGKLFNWTRARVSNVYVYYAGHGAPAGVDGSAYLVPADADIDTIELSGYRLDTLYKNLGKIPAKSITVVLESCFSGRAEGGPVVSKASPIFPGAKPVKTPRNVTSISAGSAQQMASWEKDKSHGLFTKYFLLGMSGKADEKPHGNQDSKVSNAELKEYLSQTLTYFARRHYGREQTAQIVVGK